MYSKHGYVGIALGLELEVPVPRQAVALQSENAVDGSTSGWHLHDIDARQACSGLADEREEALSLALEEHLDREVGLHDGPLPFRESEEILARQGAASGPLSPRHPEPLLL